MSIIIKIKQKATWEKKCCMRDAAEEWAHIAVRHAIKTLWGMCTCASAGYGASRAQLSLPSSASACYPWSTRNCTQQSVPRGTLFVCLFAALRPNCSAGHDFMQISPINGSITPNWKCIQTGHFICDARRESPRREFIARPREKMRWVIRFL